MIIRIVIRFIIIQIQQVYFVIYIAFLEHLQFITIFINLSNFLLNFFQFNLKLYIFYYFYPRKNDAVLVYRILIILIIF